ncbi:MAG: SPOR domain-containing protein [Pseudomonadota bacterium]|nr:SPOR domain-containing protein [Pseudomonadota bacterium]
MDRSTKHRLLGAGLLWLLAFLLIPLLIPDDDAPATPDEAPPALALQGDGDMLALPGLPMQERTLRRAEDFQELPRRVEPAVPADADLLDVPPSEEMSAGSEPAPVRDAVRPAEPAPAVEPGSGAESQAGGGWAVQVGSFGDRENAEALAERLRGRGYPVLTTQFRGGSQVLYRVRVGPFGQRPEAEAQLARVQQQLGLNGRVVGHP